MKTRRTIVLQNVSGPAGVIDGGYCRQKAADLSFWPGQITIFLSACVQPDGQTDTVPVSHGALDVGTIGHQRVWVELLLPDRPQRVYCLFDQDGGLG